MKDFEIGEKVIVSEGEEKKEAVFICKHPLAENFVIVTDRTLSFASVHHVLQVSPLLTGRFAYLSKHPVDTTVAVRLPHNSHYANFHLHSVSKCGNFVYVFKYGRTSRTAAIGKGLVDIALKLDGNSEVWLQS